MIHGSSILIQFGGLATAGLHFGKLLAEDVQCAPKNVRFLSVKLQTDDFSTARQL
jgi:hypothetical protein